MAAGNPIIAIVDDDTFVRRALRRLIASLSYEPADYPSGEAFLESLGTTVPACALVDLHMPGLNGLQVLQEMRARDVSVPTIVITANAQPEMRQRCLAAGAVAYLQKPLERDLIFSVIRSATEGRLH